mmetsp:Transcript_11526/g.35511  ORF Transcript_11526/g.35511 Transcript_11526/m.35511 type:complete len:185 (-) Transcript_11526:103-657(-)
MAPQNAEAYSMESQKAKQAENDALFSALKAAAPWAIATPAAVWAANTYSAAFRRSLGVSGKVSVAMMPAVIAFNLAGEASVLRSLRTDAEGGAAPAEAGKALSFPKRAANVFCEHTLLSFGVIIAPLYGGILYSELTKPRYEGWRLSHALIHTRVFGQAAAVGSLVLVFGLKDALRRNGAPFEA